MALTAFDQAHLSPSQQAQLQSLTAQWNSATTQAEKDALRAKGEAIRNSAGYFTSADGSTVISDNTGYSVGSSVLPSYQELINESKTVAQENNAVAQANAQAAWEFNAREAQKSRDWSEYMSNTAHQREVQDLLKAGLNPVLSATGGSGAAVPSAATGSGQAAGVDNSSTSVFGSYLNSILGSATQIAAANINAKSAENIAQMNNAMSYRIAHDFPTSDKVVGEVLQGFLDLAKNSGAFGSASNGSNGLVGAVRGYVDDSKNSTEWAINKIKVYNQMKKLGYDSDAAWNIAESSYGSSWEDYKQNK